MLELSKRVLETVERHRMFWPGSTVGVAVSGGADSVALLHLLVELAPRWNLRLKVLHVNHMLRGEDADRDAEFVRNLARSLGLECDVTTIDVKRVAQESADNLEQAARRARHGFFLAKLKGGELDRVATGHTRSDQAETVLYRLLRGAGTAGLAAIHPVTSEGLVRPLIGLSRGEVREQLQRSGISWREDSTNADTRLDRNRIRLELLPLLARDWNPAIEEALARMASIASDEEAYWTEEVDRIAGHLLVDQSPCVQLRCDRLKDVPMAVVRRLLRASLKRARGDLRGIDASHVEQILKLALSSQGSGRVSLPGTDVIRSFEWIRIAPPNAPIASVDYRLDLSVPGEVRIPPFGWLLRCQILSLPQNPGYNEKDNCDLDWRRVTRSLEVRNYRSGDCFQPAGRSARKMKEWFQRERVPLWDRAGWPMVTCGDSIVWTRRLGAAEGYAANANSTRVVRIQESSDKD